VPPFGGVGSPSNTMLPGLRPTSAPSGLLIHPATTDMGQKLGSSAPFVGVGSHLTQCGRAEAYLHAKFHLDPNIWPQYTTVTDRQIRQDNRAIALGEPLYTWKPKTPQQHPPEDTATTVAVVLSAQCWL